ncbi:MAG TPA: hypothetical protein VFJ24_08350 [Gaiellales bacterium]|nr:hypothetical protein [Gaiellales bacterium]
MQLAIIRRSQNMDPVREAFICAATNLQLREHFTPAWNLDGGHWPLVGYDGAPLADSSEYHPLYVLDSIGVEGAAGFHDDALGLIYGRIRVDSGDECWGHEAMEMRADPACDQWRPMPDGRQVALEVCDPVEADTYPVQVTIAGETRTVMVSNFVLPNFFIAGSEGPWDYMGRLPGPFSMSDGGYMVVRERDGLEHDVFACRGNVARFAQKQRDPLSRVSRRLAR